MEIQLWHILITLGIVSFIIEIFIPSFIAGSLGIGFFTAALGSYLNFDVKWIILMFSTGVLISFFGIRPLMIKYAYGKNLNRIRTNYEGIIGKKGKVMVSGKDNKTIYMPYEATAVLGSLGGIKELLNK